MRKKLVDLRFQFLRKVLELRSQPRLEPLPGPHQFAAEGRQTCPASLLSLHQRSFEEGRPLLNQIPRMPVRHTRPLGSPADFPGYPDFIQEIQHDQDGLRFVVSLETPYRFDFDVDQCSLLLTLIDDTIRITPSITFSKLDGAKEESNPPPIPPAIAPRPIGTISRVTVSRSFSAPAR